MENIISSLTTPIEVVANPVSLIILSMYAGLMLWEALFPARKLPVIKYWKIRGFIAFVVYFFLSSYLPILWTNQLIQYQLMDLTSLGTLGGALVAFIVYEFGLYTWHRSLHRSNLLWKIFHQMHHSAERLDSYGAFYFSPADMIGFTFLGSFMLVVVAGFTPEATTLTILVTTFISIFQHSNVRTPVWLGYIIQRPEGHTMHHAKGIHAYNYCDIALIDMIFGTFKNPQGHEHETGFYSGASSRVKDMLLFRDISSSTKI